MFSNDCHTVATEEIRPALPAFTIREVAKEVAVVACALYCVTKQNCYGASVAQGPGRGLEFTCTYAPRVTTPEMEHYLVNTTMYMQKVCPARKYCFKMTYFRFKLQSENILA